jgi:hypothetical protein
MGCAREGFDMFTKWGWKHFLARPWRALKYNREYIWKDTLGHHICALIGHCVRARDMFETESWHPALQREVPCLICKRCYRVKTWIGISDDVALRGERAS